MMASTLALAAAGRAEAAGWFGKKARGPAVTATRRGPTAFLLGVWATPADQMETWARRGMNVMVTDTDDWVGGHDGAGLEWRDACTDNGLKMILRSEHRYAPGSDLRRDIRDPNVLAHMTRDEPDLIGITPAALNAECAALRAAGSDKPIFVNYLGTTSSIGYPFASDGVTPTDDYVNLSGVDWLSSDTYPFTGLNDSYIFGPAAGTANRDAFSTLSGTSARNLSQGPFHQKALLHPGRAVFQYMATGRVNDISPGKPRPRLTPAQFSIQFWSSVVNGVSGILFFSRYGNDERAAVFDDTDAVIEGAIADAVAKLAILQNQGGVNVLMDAVNGGRRAFTPRRCVDTHNAPSFNYPADMPNFKTPTGAQMPGWFEGCEIDAAGDTYRLVVNLSERPQALSYTTWGMTGVSFAAGQVKCFKASEPGVDIFA